jgi:hypothetical protein
MYRRRCRWSDARRCGCRASWVFHVGRTPPALARKRSHTASLIFSAAKFRLFSGLCCAVTSTLIDWRGVNQISQATSLAAR